MLELLPEDTLLLLHEVLVSGGLPEVPLAPLPLVPRPRTALPGGALLRNSPTHGSWWSSSRGAEARNAADDEYDGLVGSARQLSPLDTKILFQGK